MLKIMTDWFTAQFKLGTPSKVRHGMRRASELTSCQNVNTMAAFLTLASLYEITGERSYLPYLDSWGEWAMNDLPRCGCRSRRVLADNAVRNEEGGFAHTTFVSDHLGQLWDDTLMM